MWRKIRGAGLAYGYFIDAVVSEGMLSFCLFKSSHPVNAFKTAKDIIVRSFVSDVIFSINGVILYPLSLTYSF